MRIFNSAAADPMLLASQAELHALHRKFIEFVASASSSASFEAEVNGKPEPYDEFLQGLRAQKTSGETRLAISTDGWLELSGPSTDLERFGQKLKFPDLSGHTHWYGNPTSLIIEADESWESSHES